MPIAYMKGGLPLIPFDSDLVINITKIKLGKNLSAESRSRVSEIKDNG